MHWLFHSFSFGGTNCHDFIASINTFYILRFIFCMLMIVLYMLLWIFKDKLTYCYIIVYWIYAFIVNSHLWTDQQHNSDHMYIEFCTWTESTVHSHNYLHQYHSQHVQQYISAYSVHVQSYFLCLYFFFDARNYVFFILDSFVYILCFHIYENGAIIWLYCDTIHNNHWDIQTSSCSLCHEHHPSLRSYDFLMNSLILTLTGTLINILGACC